MNLRHLAVFHAVAQMGSVSAAAAKLTVSQPAVSRELSELEARLGVALFDRLPRGMRLTEAGDLLYEYARRIFALEQSAQSALGEFASTRSGRLAVGASSTLGMYVLPEKVAEFHRRFPGIELTLEVGNTRDIEELLLEHKLVLGFIEGPAATEQCELHPLMRDEIVAVAPPGHPLAGKSGIAADEIAGQPTVLRETGSGTRTIVEQALGIRGLRPTPALSLGSTEAVKRAVLAGAGIAWVSRLCISDELESGKLVTLDVPSMRIHRPLSAIWLKDKRLSPAASAFLQLLGIKVPARTSTLISG